VLITMTIKYKVDNGDGFYFGLTNDTEVVVSRDTFSQFKIGDNYPLGLHNYVNRIQYLQDVDKYRTALEQVLEISSKYGLGGNGAEEIVVNALNKMKLNKQKVNWWDNIAVINDPVLHVPEKSIKAEMPVELHEAFDQWIYGQTGLHCDNGDFGVYLHDWARFLSKVRREEKLVDNFNEWD